MVTVACHILDSMLLKHTSSCLTREVLVTLAEDSGIINAWPLVPVCLDRLQVLWSPLSCNASDPESQQHSATRSLQYQGYLPTTVASGTVDGRQLLVSLATRVPMLQSRRKWQSQAHDLKTGDLVLLKDTQVHRIEWPMELIVKVIPGADGRV